MFALRANWRRLSSEEFATRSVTMLIGVPFVKLPALFRAFCERNCWCSL